MTFLDAMKADAALCNARMRLATGIGTPASRPYRQMREIILTELGFGPKTPIQIAVKAKVSVYTTRRTLHRLWAVGLVEKVSHGGIFVWQLRTPA